MTPHAGVKTTLATKGAFRGSRSQAGAPFFLAGCPCCCSSAAKRKRRTAISRASTARRGRDAGFHAISISSRSNSAMLTNLPKTSRLSPKRTSSAEACSTFHHASPNFKRCWSKSENKRQAVASQCACHGWATPRLRSGQPWPTHFSKKFDPTTNRT
jgi:hypothetical protein